MNNIKLTVLTLVLGTIGTHLQSSAVYTNFKGVAKSLPLNTPEELSAFYDKVTDLTPCFKKKIIPPLVIEYHQYLDFLKTYNTGEFLHIHPTWVLVSNFVINKRELEIGQTYQINPRDFTSPKFKIEDIQSFNTQENNQNQLTEFSLIHISPGDNIDLTHQPIDLINQPPIKLFTGDIERINVVAAIYNKLDKILSAIEKIKDQPSYRPTDIIPLTGTIENLIYLLEFYPGVKTTIALLNILKKDFSQLKQVYYKLIELKPEIRARTIRFELAQSLNNHKIFLASPYSHTKNNELIFSHQYIPAMCRLNAGGTAIGKEIRQFLKGLLTQDNGRTLTCHMLHKTHYIFSNENKDSVPFEFLTEQGEDTGQPIFAYNENTKQYSLVSINQIPLGHITTVPVLFHPEVLSWMVNVIQDNYFMKTYPELINLSGIIPLDIDTENPEIPIKPNQPISPVQPNQPITPVQPDKPVSPVQPDKPVSPAQPDKPVSPVQPNKPVSPVQPDKPVSPVQPDKPISPAQPDKPISPARPNKPISPVQPDKPISPAQPDKPVSPARPDKPISPVQPNQPITPVQPDQPVSPAQPSQPVIPVQPSQPVSPTQPDQPNPAQPDKPVNPAQPSQPVIPAQPKQPSPAQPKQPNPAQPAHPASPAQPAHPASPAQPAHPASPAQPAHPASPAQPAHPASPAQPYQPARPAQPAHPASPAQPAQPKK